MAQSPGFHALDRIDCSILHALQENGARILRRDRQGDRPVGNQRLGESPPLGTGRRHRRLLRPPLGGKVRLPGHGVHLGSSQQTGCAFRQGRRRAPRDPRVPPRNGRDSRSSLKRSCKTSRISRRFSIIWSRRRSISSRSSCCSTSFDGVSISVTANGRRP